jgi:hypothetical protein
MRNDRSTGLEINPCVRVYADRTLREFGTLTVTSRFHLL